VSGAHLNTSKKKYEGRSLAKSQHSAAVSWRIHAVFGTQPVPWSLALSAPLTHRKGGSGTRVRMGDTVRSGELVMLSDCAVLVSRIVRP